MFSAIPGKFLLNSGLSSGDTLCTRAPQRMIKIQDSCVCAHTPSGPHQLRLKIQWNAKEVESKMRKEPGKRKQTANRKKRPQALKCTKEKESRKKRRKQTRASRAQFALATSSFFKITDGVCREHGCDGWGGRCEQSRRRLWSRCRG